MKDRYTYTRCTIGPGVSCKTTSWIDYRGTTEPGKYTSRTLLNFTVWGNDFGKLELASDVLRAGKNVSGETNTWNTPGSAIQYNFDQPSMNGATFQAFYRIWIRVPGGHYEAVYKTGKTSMCSEPKNKAFKCIFP